MSKIGNIAMELDQKAAELGFQSLQEALDAGCTVEYGSEGNSRLVEPLTAAHEAWKKEKEEMLSTLQSIKEGVIDEMGEDYVWVEELETVYDWIEKEAHE